VRKEGAFAGGGTARQQGFQVSAADAAASSLSTAKLNAKEFNKRPLHLPIPIQRGAAPPPCLLDASRWQQQPLPFNPHQKMARRLGFGFGFGFGFGERLCVGRDIFLATSRNANRLLLHFMCVCCLVVAWVMFVCSHQRIGIEIGKRTPNQKQQRQAPPYMCTHMCP